MSTCAECRYHHDRGCYVAPVSVFRAPDAPACAQFAAITPGTSFHGPQRAPCDGYGQKTATAPIATPTEDTTT